MLGPGLARSRTGVTTDEGKGRWVEMHIHAAQLNLNMQMNALYAAARAEAKLAAERTRKKLMNSASALAGEVDGETDCVVSLSREGAAHDLSNQRGSQSGGSQNKQDTQSDPESEPFSDWA